MNICCKKTLIGIISVTEEDDYITAINLLRKNDPIPQEQEETPVIKEAFRQIEEYFAGKRKEFDLPLKLKGTDFQIKVWQALMTVRYGETASYGDIAKIIGQPKACRAVGGANHRNPLLLVVP